MKKKIISIASLIIGVALIVIICVYNGSSHKNEENVAANNVKEKVSSEDKNDKEKDENKESTKDKADADEEEATSEDKSTDEAVNDTTEEQQKQSSTEQAAQQGEASTSNPQTQSSNTTTAVNNATTENKTSNAGSTPTSNSGSNNTVASSKYKDGTYKGTAEGYNGPVTVSVTISGDKITSINVLSYEDDDEFFNDAKGVINKIISSQNTNVDVVSGATYSSKGIINASASAINNAKN